MNKRPHTSNVSDTNPQGAPQSEPNRREFIAGLTGAGLLTAISGHKAMAQTPKGALNIARVAIPSSSALASENKIAALNDGVLPANSFDRTVGPLRFLDRIGGRAQALGSV